MTLPTCLTRTRSGENKMAVINMGRINSFCTLCYVTHHEEIGWRSYWKFSCYGRINLHEENYDIGSLWTRSYDVQQLADR